MKVLLTAFRKTSSEKIIRCFNDTYCKLILLNGREQSVKQLASVLQADNFDYIISFGQKPVIKDKIYIELQGKLGDAIYKTDFETDKLASLLTSEGFEVRFSHNAGTSFCNHIYANGLNYIFQNRSEIKMVFIHVPFAKNIVDFNDYTYKLTQAIDTFISCI